MLRLSTTEVRKLDRTQDRSFAPLQVNLVMVKEEEDSCEEDEVQH